ncbi:TPA: TIM barrel protein [Escherichia coli]|uniref:D-psicose 3-epimerase n=1 Tax=Escherichia coli TaxID=562 RepID=UPI0017D47A73|nr:sugar phosphate isomerase/epimerase [Escherichia coli]MBS8871697.1 sugar phosphate isomerase/epimerase [Escherichia coli]HDH9112232.1 sugar phosphate isomerase/epimerase [Escherichia coli]
MKFGTLYSYWNKDWDCEPQEYATLIERLAELGFDILEVSADHVYKMTENELRQLREKCEQHKMLITTNSGPAPEYDLASADPQVRARGIAYFRTILEKMVILQSPTLAGAIYSYWPCDFVNTDKQLAWDRSIEAMKAIAETAENVGITIALEVLNRNETYIMNTCEEGIAYCERVGSKAVKILLDTYHMNIEEDNLAQAVITAGNWLGHLHVGECNRKLPGMNNSIDWPALGAALHEIGYDKGVVMEPFLLTGGAVAQSIRVWRDLSAEANEADMDRYIGESLQFLRTTFAK